ncbi:MAG: flagellin [Planctomycetota bacterium]
MFNEVSGTSLTIGENGGTTATDLGIRTLSADTPLADLNFGRGITLTQGKDDLRVIAKNGSTFDVNIDGAVTVGDVVDLINSAATDAGVSVTASLADVGNGIRLTDNTGGAGDLSVSPLNQSAAAGDLGLEQLVSGASTELLGEDRNPARTDGIFSALIELEAALLVDNTPEIAAAAERLDPFMQEVIRNHGVIGARSQSMRSKMGQMEDAAAATEVFLSEVRDVDYAEVVTRLQQSMTQLQVNMQVSSQLLRLSLLDFLV